MLLGSAFRSVIYDHWVLTSVVGTAPTGKRLYSLAVKVNRGP